MADYTEEDLIQIRTERRIFRNLLVVALEVYDNHTASDGECGLTEEWAHSVRIQLGLL